MRWRAQVTAIPDLGLMSCALDASIKLADLVRGRVHSTISLHQQVPAPAAVLSQPHWSKFPYLAASHDNTAMCLVWLSPSRTVPLMHQGCMPVSSATLVIKLILDPHKAHSKHSVQLLLLLPPHACAQSVCGQSGCSSIWLEQDVQSGGQWGSGTHCTAVAASCTPLHCRHSGRAWRCSHPHFSGQSQ